MRDYESFFQELTEVPENQTPTRIFAINEAFGMLRRAGVVGISTTQPIVEEPAKPNEELTLGQFIKRTRRALHPPVSQEKLADRAGLSVSWTQGIEQNRPVSPSLESLCRLAIAMELDSEKAERFVSTYGVVDEGISLATAKVMLPGFRQQFIERGKLPRLRK